MLKESKKQLTTDQFRKFLEEQMGLHFPKEKEKELCTKLEKIAKALNIADLEQCMKHLIDSDHQNQNLPLLAKELTIGETYFFRHLPAFDALEKEIFPEIIQYKKHHGKTIKVWSAAASSGEEAYSLAILLDKILPNKDEWKVNILGTDINQNFLEKAKKAVYTEWSFRDTAKDFKSTYFTQTGPRQYKLNTNFRQMVQFEYLNLANDTYPSPLLHNCNMDLILCNNVLIYFTPDVINQVINRLASSLREGGWLMVSTVEAPFVEHKHLLAQKVGRTFAFKKCCHPPAPQALPSPVRKTPKPIPQLSIPATREIIKPIIFEEEVESHQNDELICNIKKTADQGELDLAIALLEKGLEADDLDPRLYYYHGMLLQETGQAEDAMRAYKTALFLNPNFIMCHFNLGSILLLKNAHKEAKRHLRNTLELLKSLPPSSIIPESEDLLSEKLIFLTENLMGSL